VERWDEDNVMIDGLGLPYWYVYTLGLLLCKWSAWVALSLMLHIQAL